jgi:purine-nucleoside phosphorylase
MEGIMTDECKKCMESASSIREKYSGTPRLGIILGSGLGMFADNVEDAITIPYSEIPNFSNSTVIGHAGKFVIGKVSGVGGIPWTTQSCLSAL